MNKQVLNFIMKSLDGKNPKWGLRFLNVLLPQVVPFNRPLGLSVQTLTAKKSVVEVPLRRATKNHLGGLHACALATVGEYAAGILIMRWIDPAKQRLVLKSLTADYSKQGREDAIATAEWPTEAPQEISQLREATDALELSMTTVVRSQAGAELAKIKTLWQIKPWAQVKVG